MHIDISETLPSLAELEENWNAVYDADDEAHIFLSWQWLLRGWLSYIEGPWFILAAKADEAADLPYVAFLPCVCRPRIVEIRRHHRPADAGNFSADYTGIICRPEAENKVIPAFARHIRQMRGAAQSRKRADVGAARAVASGLLSESQLRL